MRAGEATAAAAFRDAVGNKGLSSQWRVTDGYVVENLAAGARVAVILSRAADHDVDLIVMGIYGHRACASGCWVAPAARCSPA